MIKEGVLIKSENVSALVTFLFSTKLNGEIFRVDLLETQHYSSTLPSFLSKPRTSVWFLK